MKRWASNKHPPSSPKFKVSVQGATSRMYGMVIYARLLSTYLLYSMQFLEPFVTKLILNINYQIALIIIIISIIII